MENLYKVGYLVTFKTHPLISNLYIKGDGKYVPPIMIVKEVFFENNKKKEFDDISGKQIANKIKYICVHFDDNKSEFIESHLYESQLESFDKLQIARVSEGNESVFNTDLITETKAYFLKTIDYEFGKIIYFKTKKIEAFKKRESSKIQVDQNGLEIKKIVRHYVVNYITPDFVISGFKKETYNDLFYGNGKPKRITSTDFIKVKWFNPFQQKYSEHFLPIEFFIDFNPFQRFDTISK